LILAGEAEAIARAAKLEPLQIFVKEVIQTFRP
jgi:hypothetical protein